MVITLHCTSDRKVSVLTARTNNIYPEVDVVNEVIPISKYGLRYSFIDQNLRFVTMITVQPNLSLWRIKVNPVLFIDQEIQVVSLLIKQPESISFVAITAHPTDRAQSN